MSAGVAGRAFGRKDAYTFNCISAGNGRERKLKILSTLANVTNKIGGRNLLKQRKKAQKKQNENMKRAKKRINDLGRRYSDKIDMTEDKQNATCKQIVK